MNNDTYYVCSYGGCGSKMLCNALGRYGNAKHVHSRNPPLRLEFIGKDGGGNTYFEWFNGIEVPIEHIDKYKVIYIYRNPSFAVQQRGENPAHLQHIEVEPGITYENVIHEMKDLFKISEFHNNYMKPTEKRNYEIICVKYEDIFKKQDQLSELLEIGSLNLVNKSKKQRNHKLEEIYSDLIYEMKNNDFITIV